MTTSKSVVWGLKPGLPDVWTQYALADKLQNAVGGEGGLYKLAAHAGDPRVAKIYNDAAKRQFSRDALKSLGHLVGNYDKLRTTLPFVAWPIELLFTERHPSANATLAALAGITMPEVSGANTLRRLTNIPNMRISQGEAKTIYVATQIASQLNKLHQQKIIFCDFNPGNILVSKTFKKVAFVDTDAYQHSFIPQIFTKLNFTPGYASPAALAGHPPPRTANDDNFVLAIHIFQLLLDGGHPFASGPRYDPHDDPFVQITPDDNILARRFPYSDPATYHPPGQTPGLYATLNPELRKMFEAAFVDFNPPSAQQWENILPTFSARIFIKHKAPPPFPTPPAKPIPVPPMVLKSTFPQKVVIVAQQALAAAGPSHATVLGDSWIDRFKLSAKDWTRDKSVALLELIGLMFWILGRAIVRAARKTLAWLTANIKRILIEALRSSIGHVRRNKKDYKLVSLLAVFLYAFLYVKPFQELVRSSVGNTFIALQEALVVPTKPETTLITVTPAPLFKAKPNPSPPTSPQQTPTLHPPQKPQPEVLPWQTEPSRP